MSFGGAISSSLTSNTTTLTLTGANTGSNTISGIISRGSATTFAVAKNGTGTWVLSGANTYNGGTAINTGTLTATSAAALGTGTATINTGSTLFFDNNAGTGDITFANALSGSGLVKIRTNTGNASTLSGNLSGFTGTIDILPGTTAGAGKVMLSNAGVVPSASATVKVETGATLRLNSGFTYNSSLQLSGIGNTEGWGALRIENGTVWAGSVTLLSDTRIGNPATAGTISGSIGGTGFGLTSWGFGLVLSGSNTYTGTTVIQSSFLQIGNGGTTGSLSTSSAININNAGSALTFKRSNAVVQGTDFSNTIYGVGGLTQAGSGSLTLGAVNAYTGSTTVSAGKLTIGSTGNINSTSGVSIGAGEFNYNSSTALSKSITFSTTGGTLSGSGTITNAVNVTAGNTLSPGNSIGTLTFGTGLSIAGTYAAQLGGAGATAASGTSDLAAVTGALTLTGGTLSLTNDANASGKGSARAGAYRLITFTGARTGTFASVTNPLSAILHEKVVYNGVSNGSVDLNLYRLATANTLGNDVSFGNFHTGSTLSTILSATNTALNDGYSEALAVSGSATGAASISGGATVSAGSSTGLTVGLANTAGAHSGTVVVGLASDGTGTSDYGTTALTGQTINVSGTGYNLAAANTISSTPVNLGITHVSGTFKTTSLSVQNTAANSGGYTESLNASATASGAAVVSGNIDNLGAQAMSTAISVGLNNASTATAGLVSGTVGIALASNGTISGLLDTDLGSQNVTVTGQVNEYAQAAYSGASIGTLSGSGTSYTLHLGTFDLNSGTKTATISLGNTQIALNALYQDLLNGNFTILTGAENFDLSGFAISSDIAVDGSQSLSFGFNTLTSGTFTGSVRFDGLSINTSGTESLSAPVALSLEYQVVPEPATWSMIVGGLGMLTLGQRLRRRSSK